MDDEARAEIRRQNRAENIRAIAVLLSTGALLGVVFAALVWGFLWPR